MVNSRNRAEKDINLDFKHHLKTNEDRPELLFISMRIQALSQTVRVNFSIISAESTRGYRGDGIMTVRQGMSVLGRSRAIQPVFGRTSGLDKRPEVFLEPQTFDRGPYGFEVYRVNHHDFAPKRPSDTVRTH